MGFRVIILDYVELTVFYSWFNCDELYNYIRNTNSEQEILDKSIWYPESSNFEFNSK